MMDSMMGGGMMIWPMWILWILVIVVLLLAAVALAKYVFGSGK